MKKQKSKRIVYIDVVKFLAIWMVCIGHSYPMIDMSYHSILYNCIYSFHMPLFMMLCGFFSLSSFDRPFVKFLKQKTIQLLFPVITISPLFSSSGFSRCTFVPHFISPTGRFS